MSEDPFANERTPRSPRLTLAPQRLRLANPQSSGDSAIAEPLIEGTREEVYTNDRNAIPEQPTTTYNEPPPTQQQQQQQSDIPPPPPPTSASRAYFELEPQYRVHENNCARWITVGVALLLVLGGTALAIVGRVQQSDNIIPLCPKCNIMTLAMIVAGSVIAGIGLLGLAAGVTRWKSFGILFSLLVLVVALIFFACGSLFLFLKFDFAQSEVETLWEDSVSSESGFVCNIQTRLECSGFDTCCSSTLCNATVQTVLQQCDSNCNASNAQYAVPCGGKLTSLIESTFVPLVIASYILFALFVSVTVAAVRNSTKAARSAIDSS